MAFSLNNNTHSHTPSLFFCFLFFVILENKKVNCRHIHVGSSSSCMALQSFSVLALSRPLLSRSLARSFGEASKIAARLQVDRLDARRSSKVWNMNTIASSTPVRHPFFGKSKCLQYSKSFFNHIIRDKYLTRINYRHEMSRTIKPCR
jgi:hypothetical protein